MCFITIYHLLTTHAQSYHHTHPSARNSSTALLLREETPPSLLRCLDGLLIDSGSEALAEANYFALERQRRKRREQQREREGEGGQGVSSTSSSSSSSSWDMDMDMDRYEAAEYDDGMLRLPLILHKKKSFRTETPVRRFLLHFYRRHVPSHLHFTDRLVKKFVLQDKKRHQELQKHRQASPSKEKSSQPAQATVANNMLSLFRRFSASSSSVEGVGAMLLQIEDKYGVSREESPHWTYEKRQEDREGNLRGKQEEEGGHREEEEEEERKRNDGPFICARVASEEIAAVMMGRGSNKIGGGGGNNYFVIDLRPSTSRLVEGGAEFPVAWAFDPEWLKKKDKLDELLAAIRPISASSSSPSTPSTSSSSSAPLVHIVVMGQGSKASFLTGNTDKGGENDTEKGKGKDKEKENEIKRLNELARKKMREEDRVNVNACVAFLCAQVGADIPTAAATVKHV